jgi:polyisoprenoid-binding protein YceI
MSAIDTGTVNLLGTWTVDPTHSSVEFSVRHLMITTVKGRFGKFEGSLSTTPLAETGRVEVRIDAASIDTGTSQRDAHLRSGDFLDAENHPHLSFRSSRVEGEFEQPGDRFRIYGDLTIRGVTREVQLDATFEGHGQDPWGGERASFSASTRIDRRDYGLTWNQALESGGLVVANEVVISLDVQLVKQG